MSSTRVAVRRVRMCFCSKAVEVVEVGASEGRRKKMFIEGRRWCYAEGETNAQLFNQLSLWTWVTDEKTFVQMFG